MFSWNWWCYRRIDRYLPTFVNHGSQLGLVTGSGLVEQKLNHSTLHQFCDNES
uniref:Uncharacterized protein n=1 Tax=Solanum tuberosum TaxID=4113 RepID=M1CY20_SOLTU